MYYTIFIIFYQILMKRELRFLDICSKYPTKSKKLPESVMMEYLKDFNVTKGPNNAVTIRKKDR
jgi:hypothetical protein